jgi:hypothetical protein
MYIFKENQKCNDSSHELGLNCELISDKLLTEIFQ